MTQETPLYDLTGNEITEDFLIEETIDAKGGSGSKAELFLLNVYIAIILGLGFIIKRYFLT